MITGITTKKGDVVIPKDNELFEELPKSVKLYERVGSVHDIVIGYWKIKSWHKSSIIKIERRKVE